MPAVSLAEAAVRKDSRNTERRVAVRVERVTEGEEGRSEVGCRKGKDQ
jgi:hypothetical protein